MNTVVGLVMIVWAHKERTTHWLGQGTRGRSFGGDLNPVTKVFQERNRKPVSRNRFPVSLLKYLSNRVQIIAKTIGVINLAHLRTNPFDFNPILLLDGRYTPQEAYVRATNGHCALKRPKMAKNARLSSSKSHLLHIKRHILCIKMMIYHIYTCIHDMHALLPGFSTIYLF